MAKLDTIQIGGVVYDFQDKDAAKFHIGTSAPSDTTALWIDTDDEGGEVLAAVATSGNYNDLINKPTIITSYNSLTDKPTIITMEQVKAEINTAIAAIAIYDGSVS